jgi:hypothetical protein
LQCCYYVCFFQAQEKVQHLDRNREAVQDLPSETVTVRNIDEEVIESRPPRLDPNRSDIDGGPPDIDSGQPALDNNQSEVDSGPQNNDSGQPEIDSGLPEIDNGPPDIDSGQPQSEPQIENNQRALPEHGPSPVAEEEQGAHLEQQAEKDLEGEQAEEAKSLEEQQEGEQNNLDDEEEEEPAVVLEPLSKRLARTLPQNFQDGNRTPSPALSFTKEYLRAARLRRSQLGQLVKT